MKNKIQYVSLIENNTHFYINTEKGVFMHLLHKKTDTTKCFALVGTANNVKKSYSLFNVHMSKIKWTVCFCNFLFHP